MEVLNIVTETLRHTTVDVCVAACICLNNISLGKGSGQCITALHETSSGDTDYTEPLGFVISESSDQGDLREPAFDPPLLNFEALSFNMDGHFHVDAPKVSQLRLTKEVGCFSFG